MVPSGKGGPARWKILAEALYGAWHLAAWDAQQAV